MLIICIMLALFSIHQSQQACTTAQAPFPKIIGGVSAGTELLQIDYHQDSDHLAVVGVTYDQGVRGDSLGGIDIYPIIITYESSTYIWGKVFSSLLQETFGGVHINRLATKIIVTTLATTRKLIIFNLSNGNVIAAISVTVQDIYREYQRILMLLEDGSILLGDKNTIVRLLTNTPSASVIKITGYTTVGLRTNSAQSKVHAYSYGSNVCMITKLNSGLNWVYQFQAQCSSGNPVSLVQDFQTCIFETNSSTDTIVFQEGTKFYRVNADYSKSNYTTSTLHDQSGPSLFARGLHCKNADLAYSLMWGTYSADSNSIFVAQANFQTNKFTYTRYLQKTSGDIEGGVIYGVNKFKLLERYSLALQKGASTFITGSSTQHQGVIYSPTLTCQSIDQYTYPVVLGTSSSLYFVAVVIYYSLTIPLNVTPQTLLPSNIDQTQFEDQYTSQCSLDFPQAPHDYAGLSSTQTTYQFIYAIESISSLTIPITAFTASKTSPSVADPIFVYSLINYIGSPNCVSVTMNTGDIVIHSASTLGLSSYEIEIEGKTQDCQSITAIFTLVGQPNTAPLFQGISGSILSTIHARQGDVIEFNLPIIVVDPDSGQMMTVSILDQSGLAFPKFVDFVDYSHKSIRFEPFTSTPIGAYQISVLLTDGIGTSTYTLNIVVEIQNPPILPAFATTLLNIGGPVFDTNLQLEISILAGKQQTITFPHISDPDNDQFECTVSLGSATPFSLYNQMKLLLNPQVQHVSTNPYTVTITLQDLNVYFSKSTIYQIRIIVRDGSTSQANTENVISASNSNSSTQTNSIKSSNSSNQSIDGNHNFPVSVKTDNIQQGNPSIKENNESAVTIMLANLKLVSVSNQGEAKIKIIALYSEQIFNEFTNSSFEIKVLTREDNQLVKYTIVDLSSNIMTLQLNFKNPSTLSNSQSFDILQILNIKEIKIKHQNIIEIIKKDIKLKKYIPSQLSADQAAQMVLLQKSAEYVSYALVSSNLLLNIFLSGILSYLFGLLNDISQLTMLQLININIPGKSQLIMNMLMNLIYMDLLQTNLWLEKIIEIEDDEDSLCPSFYQAGYSTSNTVSNMGSTFVFIFFLVALFIIFAFLRLMIKHLPAWLLSILEKWSKLAFWNLPVRFFIQQYQAILISSLLCIDLSLNSFQISSEDLKQSLDTPGNRFSVFLGLLLFFLSIGIPLLMIRIIYKNRNNLQTSEFQDKYGTLLEGLQLRIAEASLRAKLIPYFSNLVLLRWGIQLAILVFMSEILSLQIILSFTISFCFTIIVYEIQPYESYPGYFNINENYFKVFNEVLVTYYLIVMMTLTDLVYQDDEIRSNAGLCQFTMIFVIVFCNIAKSALIGINALIKKRVQKQNRVKKYVQDVGLFQEVRSIQIEKEDNSISDICIGQQQEQLSNLKISQRRVLKNERVGECQRESGLANKKARPQLLMPKDQAYSLHCDETMPQELQYSTYSSLSKKYAADEHFQESIKRINDTFQQQSEAILSMLSTLNRPPK
ncbi:hypothetical protein FGO68_gene12393 [Halteria grandinella]|uniref:TRP C-terminal domain-containing protein n=1 Tax=Halteria grandinella TaxID=5974 RepID=A0A8J8T9X8_HALGN|nr:hypothetical protein FGO68_gene12393 [Halteria grandinella]